MKICGSFLIYGSNIDSEFFLNKNKKNNVYPCKPQFFL